MSASLWTRLKHARIVQVLLVYLGASWGILARVVAVQMSTDSSLTVKRWSFARKR